eukprot:1277-Pleurochrysis_carterae.AAC.1
MAPNAAPPYSGSLTRRAVAATPSPVPNGSCASRASAAIVVSGDATTASTARQRSVGEDLSAGSSLTEEPAGRSRSV